ncbi:hypothetical protein [Sulfitobacter aestuariivivens]|uniref:DUF1566 domain-containing protein n=1 Tax=Sulfitobacter aestuariivivens TaxID=2766981 RepID=A0A927D469_9RHOB|nr:hypothetical protein [Sulfitobacter aestuariivivens]MBD3663554.1 hypothetical protein [Sulfitobacter aestuariivivens]
MIGRRSLYIAAVSLSHLAAMPAFPALADVTFAPLKVVGWDEQSDTLIWRPGHSGHVHTHSGGFYKPASIGDLKYLDTEIYAAAIEAGFSWKLPASAEGFHRAQMAHRCEAWEAARPSVASRLCGDQDFRTKDEQ